jgi:hypothetical protein
MDWRERIIADPEVLVGNRSSRAHGSVLSWCSISSASREPAARRVLKQPLLTQ